MGRRSSIRLCGAAAFLSFAVFALGPACYSTVPNDGLVDASFTCTQSGADLAPGTVGPGVTCSASTGTFPVGNCHLPWTNGRESCPATATSCAVGSVATCGDSRTCTPMATNLPPIYNFRMEALHVILPISLTNPLLQNEALTAGVTPNVPLCGNEHELDGTAAPHAGGFNWLISLDSSKRTIKTGGALPVSNPYATGYCFLNKEYGGIQVAPVNLDAVISSADNTGAITFSSTQGTEVLNVPIFVTATMPTDANTIILPIQGAQFHDVTISPDGNCVGDINQAWYCHGTSSCSDNDLNACPKWYTGGAFGGYMTLADADKIVLQTAGESLCAALVEESQPNCTSADLTKGDYCSTSKKVGDCKDSVWVAATFAANAVTISPSGSSACTN